MSARVLVVHADGPGLDALVAQARALDPQLQVSEADGVAPAVPGATIAELERHAILKTLEHTHGSTSRAAEILGISTRKIQYKLHEYQAARVDARK